MEQPVAVGRHAHRAHCHARSSETRRFTGPDLVEVLDASRPEGLRSLIITIDE